MQTSLEHQDLQWVLRRTPKHVLRLLKERAGTIMVGGGFIRSVIANEPVNDIDLFVGSLLEAQFAAQYLTTAFGPLSKDYKSKNAFTVTGGPTTVQIIHRWTYQTPEQLMSSFDFTIAMTGYWWERSSGVGLGNDNSLREAGWRSVCDPRFYSDLAAKRIRYTSPARNEDAGGSMLRVLKFYQKGYRIPLDSMAAVVARLTKAVRTHNQSEVELAKKLTGLLYEVDPSIDPNHIAHLPAAQAAEGKTTTEDVTEEL